MILANTKVLRLIKEIQRTITRNVKLCTRIFLFYSILPKKYCLVRAGRAMLGYCQRPRELS